MQTADSRERPRTGKAGDPSLDGESRRRVRGRHGVLAEDLDAALEVRLDDLEHRLSDLDEGGDVQDGDNHVGIEDQFIDFWSSYLLGVGSFTPAIPASELAEHLRSILRDEALTGPYAPGPFLDQTDDGYLLELAADLWNERQAYILGTR